MLDGEQVEPTSENPTVGAEPKSSLKRLGAGVRIAHQGPMPTRTASSMRPDTRRQSYLVAIEQSACKRGGVHTRLHFRSMTRPLRLEFPNALYHVTSRGDRREDIYEDDDDREKFLEILGAVVNDYNWLCHGYCLMGNHYHLIIETLDGNLSKGMVRCP